MAKIRAKNMQKTRKKLAKNVPKYPQKTHKFKEREPRGTD